MLENLSCKQGQEPVEKKGENEVESRIVGEIIEQIYQSL